MQNCLIPLLLAVCLSPGFTQKLDLLGHLNYVKTRGTDVWEYVDTAQGKVYALCGDDLDFDLPGSSIVIIEVTDPSDPILISRIDSTVAFDVKVWKNFVYTVSGLGNGVIYDLTDVTKPRFVANCPGGHNIFIDDQGYLYTAPDGSIYKIQSNGVPEQVYQGPFNQVHDHTVRDNLLISCQGGLGTFVYDVTDRTAPEIIMQFYEYPVFYHHQGDFSEDLNFLFVSDELVRNELPDITIWDISDRDNPFQASTITDPDAISHNLYIKDQFMYVAYYGAGLKVFDVSDPFHPFLVDSFDTTEGANRAEFYGTWGVYPSPITENIYITDMQNGLYIFRLSNTTAVTGLASIPGLLVYPNPTSGAISINLPVTTEIYNYSILDCTGKVYQEGSLNDGEIKGTIERFSIDLPDIPTGIFLINIRNGAQQWTRKLWISR